MEFKRWCADVMYDPDVQAAIRRAAADPTTPGWVSLLRYLTHYGVGSPPALGPAWDGMDSDDPLARLLSSVA
jgi:hypothetical protein